MSADRAARSFSNRSRLTRRLRRAGTFAIAALGVALSGGVSMAQPAPGPAAAPPPVDTGISGKDIDIATPETWREEPELASTLLPNFLKTAALEHLGGKGGTAAFVEAGVGALYINWIKTTKLAEDTGKEARALLDRLRQEPKNASEAGSEVEEVSYKEQPKRGGVEARLLWRHKANETLTSSRTLVWLDSEKQLRVVRAECVFAEEDGEKLAPICAKSLLSLDTDDLKQGVASPIGDVAAPAAAVAPEPTPPAAEPGKSDGSGPTMSAPAGQTNVLYKDDKPKSKGKMRKWFFIFGAILIVFAFWSFGQRKSKDEDEDEDEDEKKVAKNDAADSKGEEEE